MQTDYYSASSGLCLEEENKGRYVASLCLQDIFSSCNVTLTDADLKSPVDMYGSLSNLSVSKDFNVEVKQRNKTAEQLGKYPYAELRVDKLQRMMQVTPKDTGLLYCVLLNKEWCYMFSLKGLDWDKISVFNWKVKTVQVNPNSPYVTYPTYSIPLSYAFAVVPCSEYYLQYYANNS